MSFPLPPFSVRAAFASAAGSVAETGAEAGARVGGRYAVGRKVGGGAFGEIFACVDEETGEDVAAKLEKRDARHSQLEHESRVMKALEGERGVPRVRWSGVEGSYNVVVLDLLGPSLEDLLTYCGRRFTLKTTLMLADQLLHRVECVHARGFVHRDIKPDNFLIGLREEANTVHVIDFGLAKRYRNKHTMAHIVYRDGKHLTGTPRYASVNNHLGIEQSRRDDMESLGYALVYFMKGTLPWQGLRAESKKAKDRKIMERKIATTFADLCDGLPPEFRTFFEHVRTLRFDQRPNYAGLRKMFRDLFFASGFANDGLFDWTIRKREEMMVTHK